MHRNHSHTHLRSRRARAGREESPDSDAASSSPDDSVSAPVVGSVGGDGERAGQADGMVVLLEEAFEECSDGGGFFRGGRVGRTLCGDSKKRDGRSSFFTRRWQGL